MPVTDKSKGKRVLVVEDNDDVRNVVTIYLRSKGFEVHEAIDGQRGRDEAIRLQPDLILFDVLLPKMDGIEALRELRARPETATTPVVMMSAVLNTRDIQSETAKLKVSAFLQKPFQVRTLVDKIAEALGDGEPQETPNAENARATQRRARITVRDAGTASPAPLSEAAPMDNRLVCKTAPIPERGYLGSYPLPRLIDAAFADNVTGRLRIVSGTVEKRIFFQNGYPVFAESSVPEETLGAYLIDRKKITLAQHEATLVEMEFSGAHYGETLLKFGYLNPHELFVQLESHLMEKVVSTFQWTEGQFRFEPGDEWKDEVIVVKMKPGRIILDGILRNWPTEQVRNIGVLKEAVSAFDLDNSHYMESDLGLSTKEARILQLAHKKQSIAQLVHGAHDKDWALKVLFAFYVMRIIGFTGKEHAPVSERHSMPAAYAVDARASMPASNEKAQAFIGEYIKYRTADYFTLLGVPREASAEQVRTAFEKRKARYHPDQLVGVNNGLVHDKVEELNMRVHNAYRILSTPSERKKYLETLDEGATNTMLSPRSRTSKHKALPTQPQTARSKAPVAASHQHQYDRGVVALREGDYKPALAHFQAAAAALDKVKYRAYIAWTQYLANPEEGAPETELKAMLKSDPDEALIPYLLGSYYLRQKKKKEATALFEKALAIDPQNIDAARQLRILRMRKGSETSGLFEILTKKR